MWGCKKNFHYESRPYFFVGWTTFVMSPYNFHYTNLACL